MENERSIVGLALAHALPQAGGKLVKQMGQHLISIDTHAQAKLNRNIDLLADSVNADDIIRRVGQQKVYFEETLLPNVKDFDSFVHACMEYVDMQAQMLFFITNDEVSTRIESDYLKDIMVSVSGSLEKLGVMTPERRQALVSVDRYSGLCLRAYDDLRQDMIEQTGQPSLVAKWLHEEKIDAKSLPEKEAELAHLPHVIQLFYGMLAERGISVSPDMQASPAWYGLAAMSQTFATELLGYEQRARNFVDGDRIAKEAARSAPDYFRAVLKSATEQHQGQHHGFALAAAGEALSERIASAMHVPRDMDERLAPVLKLAEMKGRLAMQQSEHPVASRHPVYSRTMEDLAEGESGFLDARNAWERIMEEAHGDIVAVKTLNGIANVVDRAVDRAAWDIITIGVAPKVMDGLRAFADTLRRELGEATFGTDAYDEKALLALSHSARKCTLALENYYALQPLTMDFTEDAYDHVHTKALQEFQAEFGIHGSEMAPDDFDNMAEIGRDIYLGVLKHHGIEVRNADNPYMAAIWKRCEHLAQLKDQHDRRSTHEPTAVDAHAKTLFAGIFADMPHDVGKQGRPLKRIILDPEKLIMKLERMEREAKFLDEPKARRH